MVLNKYQSSWSSIFEKPNKIFHILIKVENAIENSDIFREAEKEMGNRKLRSPNTKME